MSSDGTVVDTRKQAGWLPQGQDGLEAWLAGHAEKVATRGEQITLHPVIREFQELLAADPTFRMSVDEMIRQTRVSKPPVRPAAREHRVR
jgi:phosphatidylserine decarboxylase